MVAKSRSSGKFVVEIDASEVINLLDNVEASVSPPGLMSFLEDRAWPYMQQRVMDRFAYSGDSASGDWPALSEATIYIKKSEDAEFPDMANVRTGAMLEFLTSSHQVDPEPGGSSLMFPANLSDPLMKRKVQVAQMGDPGPNILNPGMRATPPRPVLALDTSDVVAMLLALSTHVVESITSRFSGPISIAGRIRS